MANDDARSRKRSRAQADNEADGTDTENMPVDNGDNAGIAARKQQAADIARKRAAHFANFNVDAENEGHVGNDNVHVGGSDIRELGPWSSARQLAGARSEAASKRNSRLAVKQTDEAVVPKVTWQPGRDASQGRRPVDRVPSLLSKCISLVVEHIDDVETLTGLPESVKIRIAAALCARRKLRPQVLQLFTEQSPQEVVLDDCTALDGSSMADGLKHALTNRLDRLELVFCGRAMTDQLVTDLLGPKANRSLTALSTLCLSGAYQLRDAGVATWLSVCPNLQELKLPECSLLSGEFLSDLPAHVPKLRTLDLYKCRGISATQLLAAVKGLQNLQSLNVGELGEIDDAVLCDIAESAPHLQQLYIDKCLAVSDKGVGGIAAGCKHLRLLWADNCHRLTDHSLELLALHCPGLQVLSVRRCTQLTDEGLAAAARTCNFQQLHVGHVTRVGPLLLQALAHCCRERLQELDLSFCRGASDDDVGNLVDSCPYLVRLSVFGCTQLTPRLFFGHCNEKLQLVGMGEEVAAVVLP